MSWSVSGTPPLTLNISGVGPVTGQTTVNVNPNVTTTYTLSATNAAGRVPPSVTVTVVPDQTSPSVPANLATTRITDSQIILSWTPSIDDVLVTGYRVYRGGVSVGTTPLATYSDTGLAAATTYTYTVVAFDAAGNISQQSLAASATTLAQLPIINSFAANRNTIVVGQATALSWSVSGTPPLTLNLSGIGPVTGQTTVNVNPNVTTTYILSATNAAGTVSSSVTVTVVTDQTSPSVPANLATTRITDSQIILSWTPSIDDVLVTGYRVYRGGVSVGTTPLATYSDTGLAAATTYIYTVAAFDAAGNVSSLSPPLSATTAGQAPTIVSFTATPTIAAAGQQTILAWLVTGAPAPTLVIAPGVGDVTGKASVTIAPQSTTTYQLTATNAVGSQTASVTVTVGSDTTPPSIPANLAATVVSGSQVDLRWNASVDDVGVAGYRVFRDGALAGTTTTNSYSDTGLSAGSSYIFRVAAYDAAGNVSSQSTPVSATTAGSAPAIVFFVATPTSIRAGQSATLSWSVSGAPIPAVSIDNGVGAVTGRTSVTVSPTSTTTYQLSASNTLGQVASSATITVTAPAPSLTSVTPTTFILGTTVAATFTGTDFVPGATVVAPAGMNISNLRVVSQDTITADISTTSAVPAGATQFRINTAGGSSGAVAASVAPRPAISVTGLRATTLPTDIANVGVSLAESAPERIDGTLAISFRPAGAQGVDATYADSVLQFAAGGRTLDFTISKGATSAVLPQGGAFQQGTVAGIITVSVSRLDIGSVSVLPPQAPVGTLTVASGPPQITNGSVRIVDQGGGILAVVMTGYSTIRELNSASLQFSAAAGSQLSGDTTFTVQLSSIAAPWFNSDIGRSNGSRFSLRIPFAVSGDSNAIGGVTVTLANSLQSSPSINGGR